MNKLSNSNTANLSFKGIQLRKNLILGEKALREYKMTYGHLHSSTEVYTRMLQHEGNPKYKDILSKLNPVRAKYRAEEDAILSKINHFPTFNIFIMRLKDEVKKYKASNCEGQVLLLQHMLWQQGEMPFNIAFDIIPKKGIKTDREVADHTFTVLGLTDNININSNINKPHKWGKNSVIIDPWSGMVARTQEAIDRLKKIFRFNPETEEIKFKEYNLYPLKREKR